MLELEDEVLHRIIQQSDLNVWVYDIASDRLSFQNLSSNGIASLLAASADEVYGGMFKLAQKCVCGRECA